MLIEFQNTDISFINVIKIFSIGFMYDLVASLYYLLPLAIYLFLIPTKVYNTSLHKKLLYVLSIFILFVMIFNNISEYFFWEEFGKRFNFIAVDYLVYTHEVIKNIQESYPVKTIVTLIMIISFVIIFFLKEKLFVKDNTTLKSRAKVTVIYILVVILNFNIFDGQKYAEFSKNIYNNELAKDGLYSLFSAFRHNELDYVQFYKTLPQKEVFKNLFSLEHFDNKNPKKFVFNKSQKRKNIVLIMVESLSAEYMGIYGNKKGLTSNLDKLAKNSLFFDNFYATGTRTVRGMEAVVLSVPPTPGRSIVKRAKNSSLDSLGKILQNYKYDSKFIYAGYGYFDNMNNFFSNNRFKVIDKFDFDSDEITFANVWGVCDEDLLEKTIKEADKSYKNQKNFFTYVMTTSNHRPYTYPDNKIDIPSHTGRDGAVKYTDFAIGEFFKKVQNKPWFKDTVFVMVADHNGGSAGKTSLPLYRYKIPLIIYSPDFIKPKTVSKLSSQVDVVPTLFGLLGFDFEAKFYGNDILSSDFQQRAFIGNYQKLGYVKDNSLIYLTPDKKVHKKYIQKLSINSVKYKESIPSKEDEKEVITYYQSASILYKNSKE